MEDSPIGPVSDPRREILLSGLDDWVSLAEARSLVQESLPPAATARDVRSRTLSVVDGLLRDGLMDAGQLRPRFIAWNGAPDDVLQRIAGEWPAEDEVRVGEICWLASTPAGKALAHRLADRDDSAGGHP